MPTDAPTGYWETEAPIDRNTLEHHRAKLAEWMEVQPNLITLWEAGVYIEGVYWTFRRLEQRRG